MLRFKRGLIKSMLIHACDYASKFKFTYVCRKYKNEEAIICGYGKIDVEWEHRMLP